MRIFVALALWLLESATAPSAASRSTKSKASDALAQLVGTWDVEHVAVDGQDSIHGHYHHDEPELVPFASESS